MTARTIGDALRIEKFVAGLDRILKRGSADTESDHGDADDLLCELLVELGYEEVIAAYKKIHKWYS